MPLGFMPEACWNSITAVSVAGPKEPSAVPFRYFSSISRF